MPKHYTGIAYVLIYISFIELTFNSRQMNRDLCWNLAIMNATLSYHKANRAQLQEPAATISLVLILSWKTSATNTQQQLFAVWNTVNSQSFPVGTGQAAGSSKGQRWMLAGPLFPVSHTDPKHSTGICRPSTLPFLTPFNKREKEARFLPAEVQLRAFHAAQPARLSSTMPAFQTTQTSFCT